ncbi:phage tail protein [Paenibacillus sp. FSL E2-0151]|uniref:phage tail protein n=1 Tax=Paenibacillus sp. FSL E2-0151 TaxID=2921357 RepID=UPI0030EE571A
MPIETNRLKLPLPLGNESVSRVGINNIFEKIDEGVATREEVEELRQSVSEMDIPNASLTEKGKVQLSSKTNGDREDVAATEKAVGLAFQAGVERKAEVVAALNSIGVSASTSETWASLTSKVSKVIRATGNAVPADVLAGKTFSNNNGSNLVGTYITPVRTAINGINNGSIDLNERDYSRILFTIPVSNRYVDVFGDSTEPGDKWRAIRIGITNTQVQSAITLFYHARDRAGRLFTLDFYSVNRVPNQELYLSLYNLRIDRQARSLLFKGGTGNGDWTRPYHTIPNDFDFNGPIDVVAAFHKSSGVPVNYSVYLTGQMITT